MLSERKYGPRECEKIDLLCYFNWLDHSIVPPREIPSVEIGFRSLSIVSNRYCVVVYAAPIAPNFLRDNVGKAMEHIET